MRFLSSLLHFKYIQVWMTPKYIPPAWISLLDPTLYLWSLLKMSYLNLRFNMVKVKLLVFLQHVPISAGMAQAVGISHSLTRRVPAIGKSCRWFLPNTSFFLTTSTALTLIQDISHLDHCNSLLKCFPRFSSCAFDLLSTYETSF